MKMNINNLHGNRTSEVTKHHGSEFWMDKLGNLVMILQKAQ